MSQGKVGQTKGMARANEENGVYKLLCPICGRKKVLGWKGVVPGGDWEVEVRCSNCGIVYLSAKSILKQKGILT